MNTDRDQLRRLGEYEFYTKNKEGQFELFEPDQPSASPLAVLMVSIFVLGIIVLVFAF